MIEKHLHGVKLTDEQLLVYLLRWSIGSPMPTNHNIIEKHLYDAEPWRVLGDVDASHWAVSDGKRPKSTIHVITKLTRIKTRVARRAGCGSWSGQTSAKNVFDGSGRLIGSKKLFNFDEKGSDARNQYHWIMNEYSLAGTYLNNDDRLRHRDYVICRITRTSKCKLVSRNTARLSGKKRVRMELEAREEVSGSCDEAVEEASCSSGAHDDRANDYDEIGRMIAESSVSSPGSIGFGELTQEDLDILNSIFIWT